METDKNSAIISSVSHTKDSENMFFISSSTGFFSSTQLTGVANIAKRLYAPVISITENRRIAISGKRTINTQEIKDYLLKYNLTATDENNDSEEKIDENLIYADSYPTYTVTASMKSANDWTLKKLRGLAALIKLENLSGLYLLGQTGILLSSKTPNRHNALRHGLDELGFSLTS